MLKASQLMQVTVCEPKRENVDDPAKLDLRDLTVVGKIRQVVFAPQGDHVVGFLVRRPDIAGMIKRDDAFLALDSFVVGSSCLITTRGAQSLDDAARERLGLDWDACILWAGMDAKTTDGKELGWVDDVSFSPKTGRVESFYVGDGGVAKSLVGTVVIPGNMLRGYSGGFMLVDPAAAGLALNGGLAAKAGESYARAKHEGKEVASKAGKAAGTAVEKGAHGLGRVIGKTKKRTSGMFGSFMDEFKKASK